MPIIMPSATKSGANSTANGVTAAPVQTDLTVKNTILGLPATGTGSTDGTKTRNAAFAIVIGAVVLLWISGALIWAPLG